MIKKFSIFILRYITFFKIFREEFTLKVEYKSIFFSISFAVGILFQLYYNFTFNLVVYFAILLLSILFFLKKRILISLCILFFLFGIIRLNFFQKNNFEIQNNYINLSITGKITNIILKKRITYLLIESNKDIFIKENYKDFRRKTIIIRYKIKKNNIDNIKIGDNINFIADIYKIAEENFKFNASAKFFANYNRIAGYGKIKNILNIKKTYNFLDKIKNFRIDKIKYIINTFPDNGKGIPIAILLGNTNFIPNEQLNNIRHIGIAHILAISGLHISIIMIFSFFIIKKIISLFSYFAIRYDVTKIASLISILFCYFYLFISGMSISAFRSFLMIFLSLFCVILNKKPSSLYFLNISFFIILINNPLAIQHPSFQLSFIAVLSLIGGYKYLFKTDIFFNLNNSIYSSFVKISITEILTIFATTMFEIYHFGQFVFLGFLSNFIIIPFVEFIILPSSFLSFLPLVGDFFMNICIFFSNFIYHFSDFFSKIPFCYFLINQTNNFELCIATTGLLMIFIVKNNLRKFGLIIFLTSILFYLIRIEFLEKRDLFLISKNKANILVKYNNEFFYLKGNKFDLKNFAQKFGQKKIKSFLYINELFINPDEIDEIIETEKITEKGAIVYNDFTVKYK